MIAFETVNSLVYAKNGSTKKENIRCIRPGLGLPPERFDDLLGKTAASDIEYGTPIEEAHIS